MRAQPGRFLPLTGLVFAVLLYTAFFAFPSSPNAKVSSTKAVAFFSAHRHGQLTIAFLVWYAVLFLVLFAVTLWARLRGRAELALSTLGLVGAALFALAWSIMAGLLYAAADVPGKIEPASEQALNVLQNDLFPIVFVCAALFMLGFGLAISRSDVLPHWLGWLALLLALVAVVPPLSFFSVLVLPAWATLTGLLLVWRPQSEPTGAPAVAAASG